MNDTKTPFSKKVPKHYPIKLGSQSRYSLVLRPIPVFITLAALILTFSLSHWQWGRSQEKAQWLEQQQQYSEHHSFNLKQALQQETAQFQRIHDQLNFDTQHIILLDNQIVNRIAGYHVYQLAKNDISQHVLINRGWIARGPNRTQLPNIPSINGFHNISGHVYIPSDKAFVLQEDSLSQMSWPLRVQKIDLPVLEQKIGVQLAPFIIRLDAETVLGPEPLLRQWQQNFMGPEVHIGYALQWLLIGLASLVIFLFASTEKSSEQE